MEKIVFKELSYEIQGAFYEVYKAFGNVFKEGIYHEALKEEFRRRGLNVESEKKIDVYYHGKRVGSYVPDFVVEDRVIIEIKSKPVFHDEDVKQFWNYLKGSEFRVGYLVNFGKTGGVELIRRVYDTARGPLPTLI